MASKEILKIGNKTFKSVYLLGVTYFILAHCSCFSFSVETTYQYDSPVYENEILILQGDTISIKKAFDINEHFYLQDSSFYLLHLNIEFKIRGAMPTLDSTLKWSSPTSSEYPIFKYFKKDIKNYTITLTRLPYTAKTTGYIPNGQVPDKKTELIDSLACKIECSWDGNNKYYSIIQALRYRVHTYE